MKRSRSAFGLIVVLSLVFGLAGAACAAPYLVFPGRGMTTASLLEAARNGGPLEGKILREMPLAEALVADLTAVEAEALEGSFALVPADLTFQAGADPLTDLSGHGTAVTGMIVGNRTGVCPYVKVVPVKIADDEGVSTTGSMTDALEYTLALAQNQLRGKRIVINFSHSADPYTSPQSAYETFFNHIYDSLARYNIFFVSAAGNKGLNLSGGQYAYPASVEGNNEVSVSAYKETDGSFVLDKTMNYGHDVVEVAAPGTSVVTTNTLGGYVSATGTSFAAPYVTGIAAYLWANNPGLTPMGMKETLKEMSTRSPYMEVIARGPLSPELLMDPLPSGPVSRPAAYDPHGSAWHLDGRVNALRDHPDAFDFDDVVVVVWDTGVAADHPDLRDHLRADLAHDSTGASPSGGDGGGCGLGFTPAALLLVLPLVGVWGRK